MNIKTQITPFLAIIIALLVQGCNDQLDLKPENTLVDADVFSTADGTAQALAGAYYSFLKASIGTIPYVYGDLTTANLDHSSNYDIYDNAQIDPSDATIQSIWQAYYETINQANNILAKISQYAHYEANLQNQYVAEAKFIRAYTYLELLKLFGDRALSNHPEALALPLQLTPFEGYDTGQLIARSTNADVYAQITKDLQSAAQNLPAQQSTDLKTRSQGTQGGAYALLSRAYLYQQDYRSAAEAAAKVLALTNVYSLSTNLLKVFPPNPDGSAQNLQPEHIYALPISQMAGSSSTISTNIFYYYKTFYWINKSFLESYDPTDLRFSQLIYKGDSTINPDKASFKTTYKFNNINGRDNVPLIRLPEVLLTRAEALVRVSGPVSEAITLLNQVRSRALPNAIPYTPADFTNTQDLLDHILNERRKELAFEGFYRYDRIRNGQAPQNASLAEEKWVFPIPQHEIDISQGLIKQNPGYAQ